MGDCFSQAVVLIDQIILREESGVHETIVTQEKVVRFTCLRLEQEGVDGHHREGRLSYRWENLEANLQRTDVLNGLRRNFVFSRTEAQDEDFYSEGGKKRRPITEKSLEERVVPGRGCTISSTANDSGVISSVENT